MPTSEAHGAVLSTEAATEALGAALARVGIPPLRVFLSGELGAGKTTFVRGFLRALGYKGLVKSPTYTIVETYTLPVNESHTRSCSSQHPSHTVAHFDLYRLTAPSELHQIGAEEYFANADYVFVEWSEQGKEFLPTPDLECEWTWQDQNTRRVAIRVFSERGEVSLSAWQQDKVLFP